MTNIFQSKTKEIENTKGLSLIPRCIILFGIIFIII